MARMTEESKAAEMRKALGKLAGEFMTLGNMKAAKAVMQSADALDGHNESLARLFDIVAEAGKIVHPLRRFEVYSSPEDLTLRPSHALALMSDRAKDDEG